MASNTEKEFLDKLVQIQDQNPPSIALLPSAEKVYNVDMATRSIEAPKFLSVEKDHKSETIYFRINRYNDYMDLSTTVGVVQYENVDGESYIYPIPFYDIMTEHTDDKMLFPWCIDGAATKKAGTIKYAIRFYRVGEVEGKNVLVYNLNTLPATGKVLYGMEVKDDDMPGSDQQDIATHYETLLAKIAALESRDGVYWNIYE